MVSRKQARRLALALPEAVEHGRPSFRVANRIFAIQRDDDHMNVMLDEGGILTAVHRVPETFEGVWWGKRFAAVRVDLRRVDAEALANLLEEAWEVKAPKRLLLRLNQELARPQSALRQVERGGLESDLSLERSRAGLNVQERPRTVEGRPRLRAGSGTSLSSPARVSSSITRPSRSPRSSLISCSR